MSRSTSYSGFSWQCPHCLHKLTRATMVVLELEAIKHEEACAETRAKKARQQAARDAQPSLFDTDAGGSMR